MYTIFSIIISVPINIFMRFFFAQVLYHTISTYEIVEKRSAYVHCLAKSYGKALYKGNCEWRHRSLMSGKTQDNMIYFLASTESV